MAKQKWYTFGRKRLYVQALIISPAFKVIIGKRKGETSNLRFVKYLVFYDDKIQAVKHNFIRSKNARCMQQATTNAGLNLTKFYWIGSCTALIETMLMSLSLCTKVIILTCFSVYDNDNK
jgi:hypothetical protein